MAIKLIPFDGGKIIQTETREEGLALAELSISVSQYDKSKAHLRRAQRAWLRFERLLGEKLEKTMGISRSEIIKDNRPHNRKSA